MQSNKKVYKVEYLHLSCRSVCYIQAQTVTEVKLLFKQTYGDLPILDIKQA